jgi:hypothetical protein
MDMDQSAVFLAGSILTVLGFVIIATGIIVINNIASKYWKPVTIFTKESFSLFGHNSNQSPINTINDEEYEELIKHLERIRSKTEEKKK